MVLEIMRGQLYGGFENWITGETDYTILDNAIQGPHGRAKQVASKWGLIVNDQTFESTFDEFIAEFHKYERETKK